MGDIVKFLLKDNGDFTFEGFYSTFIPLKLAGVKPGKIQVKRDGVIGETELISARVFMKSRNMPLICADKRDLVDSMIRIHDITYEEIDPEMFSTRKQFNLNEVQLPSLSEIMNGGSKD